MKYTINFNNEWQKEVDILEDQYPKYEDACMAAATELLKDPSQFDESEEIGATINCCRSQWTGDATMNRVLYVPEVLTNAGFVEAAELIDESVEQMFCMIDGN